MAPQPLEIPPDGKRCTRSSCGGRCRRPRCPGRRLCEKHYLISSSDETERSKKNTKGKKLSSRIGDPASSSAAKRPHGLPVAVAIRAKEQPPLTGASSAALSANDSLLVDLWAHDSTTGPDSIVELRQGEDDRGRKGRPGSRGGKMVEKKWSSRQKEKPVVNKVGMRNRPSDAAAEKKLESKKRKRSTPKNLQLEKVKVSSEVSNPLALKPIKGDVGRKKQKGKPWLRLKRGIFYASLKKDWVTITTELSAPHINVKQEEQTMGEVVPPLEIPKVSRYARSDARKPLRVVTLRDIWVLFHDADSLPRTYARIERILPVQEKVQVTLLKFHPVCDEEMLWVEKGVPVSCGMYRTSKSMVLKDMSILSQLVLNEPDGSVLGLKTFYKIFPKKGEIWAVFRDCSESETCPLFHLVEVLTNFSEVDGVTVSVLMPVDGLKGLFMRQTSGGLFVLRSFSRRELLRFSHRLPALRVAKKGGGGCFAAFWKIG